MTDRNGTAIETITLSHGSGGRDMHALLDQIVFPILGDAGSADAALEPLANLSRLGDRLAYTTDSYTVTPLFFPGGDIGSLAVNGTINDLAVMGAAPQFLSCSLIIEEGFGTDRLKRVLQSMRKAADEAEVRIVTGDTKVVHRGSVDGLFINTSGIGVVPAGRHLQFDTIQPGDRLLVTGFIGDHGAAVLAARGDLHLDLPVDSDCKALHTLVEALLRAAPNTRALRDATRGGVATVLNEMAGSAGVGIVIEEARFPLRPEVRGACELLGLDPLNLANEGLAVIAIPEGEAEPALAALREHPAGANAALIGCAVSEHSGMVSVVNPFNSERVLDLPAGEILPRIC